MKKEYDFANMKSIKNPYAKKLKKQITIKLNPNTIEYFKTLATKVGIPYQTLMDSYLTDCAVHKKEMQVNWA